MGEPVTYEREDGVAWLVIDRPEARNAINRAVGQGLWDGFRRFEDDREAAVLVLTGAGDTFSAGADLKEMAALGLTVPPRDMTPNLGRNLQVTKPVIAAVNGPAVGVGVTMTLPMDVRLASDTARFGFVFTRRGLVPEAASSWFLPRVVGISRALEWVVTGRIFPATEAREGGLVRSIHPPDELLPAARALAREMAEGTSPVSVALSRQMLWRMLGAAHPMDAHRIDSRGIAARGASADAREGVESFLEKRPASFPLRVSDGMPDFYPWWEEPEFS